MQKVWLIKINFLVLAGALFFFLLAGFYYFLRPSEIHQKPFDSRRAPLPMSAFPQKKEAYNALGPPFLDLHFSPPSMRLPDFRNLLIYYGKNGRPDALADRPLLHFGLTGTKTAVSISSGAKLYLFYDKSQTPAKYIFSTNNSETGLWIEPTLQGNEALVNAGMKNENGAIIREPQNLSHFTLPEKEYARFAGGVWELGKWRVDGTLLARQRSRWYGTDLFLEQHGGDEYKEVAGAQSIEFGEGDEKYSVIVKQGDTLIWAEEHWKVVPPGTNSLGHPMLVVKKIDDRLMNLELWDVEGKGKILLNLLKSTDPILSQNILNDFKFVGARTRSQFVFEIRGQRVYVRPEDWFLLTEEGWKKLTINEEIDNYVNKKTPGILFVINQITRKDERQVLLGTIYNPSRSQMETIEVPMLSSSTATQTGPRKDLNENSSSEDDSESTPESMDDDESDSSSPPRSK